MRENRNNRDGRTIKDRSNKKKKKYLLVFEGAETEEIYFDAFKEYIPNLLFEVVTLIRSNSENGFSNPEKMLEMILENLKEREEDKFSYHTLIDWIVDYVKQNRLIHLKSYDIKPKLEKICKDEIESNLDKKVKGRDITNTIKKLLEKLLEIVDEVKCEFKNVPKEMIQNLIKENEIEYDSEIDEIVMVVDRDKGSFTPEQYENLVHECNRNKIRLVVTNPCFEFWLLLHFDVSFDKNKMLKNAMVKEKVTYCHDILHNTFEGYHKNSYNVRFLMGKIKKAIQNEQKYCEDIIGLKTKIGSNVGKLLKDLGYGK